MGQPSCRCPTAWPRCSRGRNGIKQRPKPGNHGAELGDPTWSRGAPWRAALASRRPGLAPGGRLLASCTRAPGLPRVPWPSPRRSRDPAYPLGPASGAGAPASSTGGPRCGGGRCPGPRALDPRPPELGSARRSGRLARRPGSLGHVGTACPVRQRAGGRPRERGRVGRGGGLQPPSASFSLPPRPARAGGGRALTSVAAGGEVAPRAAVRPPAPAPWRSSR